MTLSECYGASADFMVFPNLTLVSVHLTLVAESNESVLVTCSVR